MIIEIDEKQIENMQEDIDGYIDLIKRYDQDFKLKSALIDGYEKELKNSKEIILILIKMLKSKRLPKDQKKVIEEIEASILELEY